MSRLEMSTLFTQLKKERKGKKKNKRTGKKVMEKKILQLKF